MGLAVSLVFKDADLKIEFFRTLDDAGLVDIVGIQAESGMSGRCCCHWSTPVACRPLRAPTAVARATV
jgi:hypothetical protein